MKKQEQQGGLKLLVCPVRQQYARQVAYFHFEIIYLSSSAIKRQKKTTMLYDYLSNVKIVGQQYHSCFFLPQHEPKKEQKISL